MFICFIRGIVQCVFVWIVMFFLFNIVEMLCVWLVLFKVKEKIVVLLVGLFCSCSQFSLCSWLLVQVNRLVLWVVIFFILMDIRQFRVMFNLIVCMMLGVLVLNCIGLLLQVMVFLVILWIILLLFKKGCILVMCFFFIQIVFDFDGLQSLCLVIGKKLMFRF